jgi:thiamine phosphate phosphatase / amino-HMP aminohydrolase
MERFYLATNVKASNGRVPSTEPAPIPASSTNGEWHKFGVNAVKDQLVTARNGIDQFGSEVAGSKRGLCGIVSVNFSRDFVRGVVSAVSPSLRGINVVANVPNAASVLEGFNISDKGHPREVIATSDGKLAAMKELLGYWREKGELAEEALPAVYIGDSGTDIECLMEDGVIGIVISEDGESSLMETLKRVDVEVDHVEKFQESEEKSVFWARDFTEIVQSRLFNQS